MFWLALGLCVFGIVLLLVAIGVAVRDELRWQAGPRPGMPAEGRWR